ncbi:MAG: WecB/TagA/CpsF family glycosyltransferase [Bacteroidales bacterium]|nr:WecB/TagA/CpsF family glycosyltransferase [Bacteroidales bacterium]
MANRIPILNIEVDNISKSDLLKEFKSGVLITPNVDHLMKLQNDREFYEIYQQAEYVTVDSRIVSLSMKYLGTPVKEVITGSDFFPSFYNFHKDNPDIKVFLLGAMPGVAKKALHIINEKIGREIIVGEYSPSFGFEKNENECNKIIQMLNASPANVLVVGVGAPKQEKWIYKYKDQLNNIDIFLAIGATIDFEAGNIKRAPKIFQKLALEWLYRLMKEPKRLWRRYIVEDLPFFLLILKQKRNKYKNPFKTN